MKSEFLAVSTSVLLLAGCSGSNEAEPVHQSPEITVQYGPTAPLNPPIDAIAAFKTGVIQLKAKYGCPTSVEVAFGEIPNDDNTGTAITSVAIGSPGEIIVNQEFPELYAKATNKVDLIHAAGHEAVHACQLENKKPFETIQMPGQDLRLTGVQGLTLITDRLTPDGKDFQKLTAIEEGAADIIGTDVTSKPSPPGAGYGYYEALTRKLMAQGKMTVKQLVDYTQQSDIYGFLAQVSGISDPKPADLIDLLYLYQKQR